MPPKLQKKWSLGQRAFRNLIHSKGTPIVIKCVINMADEINNVEINGSKNNVMQRSNSSHQQGDSQSSRPGIGPQYIVKPENSPTDRASDCILNQQYITARADKLEELLRKRDNVLGEISDCVEDITKSYVQKLTWLLEEKEKQKQDILAERDSLAEQLRLADEHLVTLNTEIKNISNTAEIFK